MENLGYLETVYISTVLMIKQEMVSSATVFLSVGVHL